MQTGLDTHVKLKKKKYFTRVASLFHESLNLFIVPIGFKLPNGLDAS
jgi:hypothetical protein